MITSYTGVFQKLRALMTVRNSSRMKDLIGRGLIFRGDAKHIQYVFVTG